MSGIDANNKHTSISPSDKCGDTIGLDLGTTACKGVRLNSGGALVAAGEVPTPRSQPHPGWVETDPQLLWSAVCDLIRQLVADTPQKIRAVAISGAAGNTILSSMQGEPLRPVINWMDNRARKTELAALDGITTEELRRITGWPCVDSFPLAHLAWLKQNEPAVFKSAGHYGIDIDWLNYKLTEKWVIDFSTATTCHLQNQVQRKWHRPYLQRLGIREDQLSRLVAPGTLIGHITAEAAIATGLSRGTKVVTGSFDHPSAARAAAVCEPGSLMLSCGTSWVCFLPWQERNLLVEMGLLCDPFLSSRGGPWAGMLSIPAIGTVIDDYLHKSIAPGADKPFALFDQLAAEAPAGATGLVIDLLSPWHPQPGHSRANVARAVMEAAASLLAEKLASLSSRGFTFKRAVMVGGPGRSPIWPAIIAARTGLEISPGPSDAGARGAALLAGE